jgi:hypothetical protein
MQGPTLYRLSTLRMHPLRVSDQKIDEEDLLAGEFNGILGRREQPNGPEHELNSAL